MYTYIKLANSSFFALNLRTILHSLLSLLLLRNAAWCVASWRQFYLFCFTCSLDWNRIFGVFFIFPSVIICNSSYCILNSSKNLHWTYSSIKLHQLTFSYFITFVTIPFVFSYLHVTQQTFINFFCFILNYYSGWNTFSSYIFVPWRTWERRSFTQFQIISRSYTYWSRRQRRRFLAIQR